MTISSCVTHHSCKKVMFGLLIAASFCTPLIATAQNIHLNDMTLKSDLDWLKAQGVIQISTSTWPLTNNEIKYALSKAQVNNESQKQVLQSVQNKLTEKPESLVYAQAEAYGQVDRKQLPQGFADNRMADLGANFSVGINESNWDLHLQVNLKEGDEVRDKHITFDNSYVAGSWKNQWLIAGLVPTWWGPGNDGSLIRGDATEPVIGFTMQRDRQTAPTLPYLNLIGPWQYQLFAGQLNDYDAVPDTKLIGMRLNAHPTDWLELGASRSIMWGGEGRPESLNSLWHALKGTDDNGGKGFDRSNDPANQLAGFDIRLELSPLVNLPAGIYGQYIGEDEAGALPAKNMYLGGIDYANALSPLTIGSVTTPNMPYQVYAEYTDSRTGGKAKGISYDHGNYTDGYYQYGYPLGYALGGDARSISVGGKLWVDDNNFITSKLQYAKVNETGEIDLRSGQADNQAYPRPDKLKVVDVAWEHTYNPKTTISSRLWAVDSDYDSPDIGAGIGIKYMNF